MTAILVKAPNWVGDCIMATPALEFLRTTFPEARVNVLARPSVAGVLEGNPHITGIIVADDRRFPVEIAEALRRTRYAAAALLPNSFGSAWLAFRLRIPRRIGFSRGGRRLLLTHPLKYRALEWQTCTPKPLSSKSVPGPHKNLDGTGAKHMVHYYLRIVEETAIALGARLPIGREAAAPKLHLVTQAHTRSKVDDLLAERQLTGKRLVGINPGAAYGAAKRWPPDRLAQVADAFAADGAEIVSTASKSEAALTDAIQSHASTSIHRLGEELNLAELAALLPHLSLLVSNDSGVMHMAAALQVPTIAIFGPTDWNVTFPWQPNAVVVRQSPDCAPCFLRECPIDHRCMQRISAERVIASGKQLLAKTQARLPPQEL